MSSRDVGGYHLLRQLGYGGMSTVWEAEDGGGRRVALKLLRPDRLREAGGRERVEREIRVLQRVRGPFVAEVLDAEVDGPEPFIVTELIDGPTLAEDVAQGGPYEPGELAELAAGLRAALSSVHHVGVLHRDLKPSNVMLAAQGPVLIDFGIAQGQADARLTQVGAVTHTPGYLDPRVLRGAAPDEAADWWALAAVLAFAATGRHPFGEGSVPVVMRRVLDGDADLAGLPAWLARALGTALAPELEGRLSFATLEERIAAGEPGPGDATQPVAVQDVPAPTMRYPLPQLGRADEAGPADMETVTRVLGNPDANETPAPTQVLNRVPGAVGNVPAGEVAAGYVPTARLVPPVSAAPAPYPGRAAAVPPAPQPPAPQYVVPQPYAYSAAVVPDWARPPRPVRLGVLSAGVAVGATMMHQPGPMTMVLGVVLTVLGGVGRTASVLRRRRWEHGGHFRGEHVGAVFSFVWGLLSSAVVAAVLLGVGGAAGLLTMYVAFRTSPVPPVSTVMAVSAAVMLLVAWFLPGGARVRRGAREVGELVVPSTGFRVFWCLALAALAVGCVGVALEATSVAWAPFPVPGWFPG